jgi:outer membrane lipopolysaccharide assembly protein LptE/RlpB
VRGGRSYSFIKIVGVILSLLFFYYLISEAKSINNQSPENEYLEKQKKLNEIKIIQLQNKVDSLNLSIQKRSKEIITIQTTKKQLEYVYTNKIKEVDNLNVNGIVDQFKIIFAKSNIK